MEALFAVAALVALVLCLVILAMHDRVAVREIELRCARREIEGLREYVRELQAKVPVPHDRRPTPCGRYEAVPRLLARWVRGGEV